MAGFQSARSFLGGEGRFVDQNVGAGGDGDRCFGRAGVAGENYAAAGSAGANEFGGFYCAAVRELHGFTLMDFSPERALGNSHLAGFVGIESAKPGFFGDMITDRDTIAVLDGERDDRVAGALEGSLGSELEDLDLEMLLFAAEGDRSP